MRARTMRHLRWFTNVTLLCTCAVVGVALGCGPGEPRTDAERLTRGREIIERMSTKLGATPAFSVTTVEQRNEINRKGEVQPLTLTRDTTIRRPDRLYSTVSGDRHNEVWYDGVGITVVLH